jgi:preprotein translocase subunit SecG
MQYNNQNVYVSTLIVIGVLLSYSEALNSLIMFLVEERELAEDFCPTEGLSSATTAFSICFFEACLLIDDLSAKSIDALIESMSYIRTIPALAVFRGTTI